jgi:hypothetical protein
MASTTVAFSNGGEAKLWWSGSLVVPVGICQLLLGVIRT